MRKYSALTGMNVRTEYHAMLKLIIALLVAYALFDVIDQHWPEPQQTSQQTKYNRCLAAFEGNADMLTTCKQYK